MRISIKLPVIWLPFATGTAIVGHTINHSVFWTICDFIFCVEAWVKWFIFQEVSVSIIKHAFSFFLN